MAYPARHAAVKQPLRHRLKFFRRKHQARPFVPIVHQPVVLDPVVLPQVRDIPYNTQYGGVRPIMPGAVTMGWITLDRKK
jgi:hypothetical protein